MKSEDNKYRMSAERLYHLDHIRRLKEEIIQLKAQIVQLKAQLEKYRN